MLKKKNIKIVLWDSKVYKFRKSRNSCSECMYSKIGLRSGMIEYPCSRQLIYGLDRKLTSLSYLCQLFPGYTLVKYVEKEKYINSKLWESVL